MEKATETQIIVTLSNDRVMRLKALADATLIELSEVIGRLIDAAESVPGARRKRRKTTEIDHA